MNDINNNINGNTNSKKLIITSFHDSSLLYLLGALNITDGIQPNFAELFNIEIYYTKSNSYVFRMVRNGVALKFPGCQYQTNSELCGLNILLNYASYSMDIITWEPYCNNITTTSLNKKKEKSNHKKYHWIDFDIGTYIFGVSSGVILSLLFGTVWYKCNQRNSLHIQFSRLQEDTIHKV